MRVFCRLASIAIKPPRTIWSREALLVKYTRSTSSSSASQPPEKHPWIAQVAAPKSFKPEERVLTFLAGLPNALIFLRFSGHACQRQHPFFFQLMLLPGI
jgi:hypothetical protein